MESIVTLLAEFLYLVPKSLEVGPQLNPAGFGSFIIFTSFFLGFYNMELPLKFLSSLDNSHRKGELYFVCQKTSPIPPTSKKAGLDPDGLLCFFVRKLCFLHG